MPLSKPVPTSRVHASFCHPDNPRQWRRRAQHPSFREEFYARVNLLADSLSTMRRALQKAVHKHNTYRPHASLNGLIRWAVYSIIPSRGPFSYHVNLYTLFILCFSDSLMENTFLARKLCLKLPPLIRARKKKGEHMGSKRKRMRGIFQQF